MPTREKEKKQFSQLRTHHFRKKEKLQVLFQAQRT